jgi:GcrA cell cycle regulator
MAWTDDRVELLKKLWAEGLSASQIANQLGGVTRNAVIGKVHRLGLSGRTTTSRTKAARPRRRTSNAPSGRSSGPVMRTHGNVALKAYYAPDADEELKPAPALIEELVIPISERASILTLKEDTCRWPIGDPGDEEFHFCGRHSEQGVPYCPHHCHIAYQPAQARRRGSRAVTR